MWHRKVFLLSWLLLSAAPAIAGVFDERKEQCVACHGDKGVSPTPDTPSLGGQPELFVLYQLVGFRDGQRKFELMNEMMKGMSDDDLRAAAAFIVKMPPPPKPDGTPDAARMARGKKLADENRCGVCHNADFAGHDQMPRIAHQREDYLVKALREYKSDKRFGGGAAMNEVLYPLDDKALADLAYFMAHAP
jgi:cytochrome c553